jgi:hypothetical protein
MAKDEIYSSARGKDKSVLRLGHRRVADARRWVLFTKYEVKRIDFPSVN